MKSKTKWLATIATLAVVFVLVLSLGLSTIFASADGDTSSTDHYYYNDFNSEEEAFAAAEDLNASLAEEGMVLLKNDDSLPLKKGAKVSVLGIAQDCLVETSGSVTESLSDAGFKVNPTLKAKYDADGASDTSYGSESDLNGAEIASMGQYNDAAIVVIGRGEKGEGRDRSLNTGEVDGDTYLGDNQGWTHEAHETDEGGNEYKHEMQLTESEEKIIKIAEENCENVIVLYTSANVFEMANIQNDPNVNAIAWIGRLGNGGIKAVGEMLCGDVNPSGRTVDEWTRDFTNDPTYANFDSVGYVDINGNKNEPDLSDVTGANMLAGPGETYDSGSKGMDYEEDIYLGYKFYETYWKEGGYGAGLKSEAKTDGQGDADKWYAENVVYPFGYGVSYTEFSYNLKAIYTGKDSVMGPTSVMSTDSGGKKTISLSDSDIASGVTEGTKSYANVETLYAEVEVENVGEDYSGKDVVEIYVEAPYTSGGIEKAAWTLVGYGKTDEINPGKTDTVTIAFNVQDFASYDYSDANNDGHTGYELDQGEYKIHVMQSSSHDNMSDTNAAYEVATFSLSNIVHLDLDDYSGNEVENLFSTLPDYLDPDYDTTGQTTEYDAQSDFYSMTMSEDAGSMVSPLTATDDNPATILSRSGFDDTMPKAPVVDGVSDQNVLSDAAIAAYNKYDFIDADGVWRGTDNPYSDEGMIWEKSVSDLPASWTQGSGVAGSDGLYPITLNDMADVEWDVGETGSKWDEFMNQLTWDEIASLLNAGYHYTVAVPTIGKVQTWDENGPNYTASDETGMIWVAEPTISATWNTDLAKDQGRMVGNCALLSRRSSNGTIMTGWYGPGMNTHRSAFSGRNAEYYSQDGIQGGYIAAAVCQGAAEKGINVYIKHFAIYDRSSMDVTVCANITEQNMRENYLKPFQMAMQEGDAHSAMSSFNRIGGVYAGQNYALIQQLARDEWGWNGFIVTDIYPQNWCMSIDGLIRAGAEIPDGDSRLEGTNWVLSGEWDATYEWTEETDGAARTNNGAVMLNGVASPTQWYCARMSATRILYNEAHSAGNNNGVYDTSIELSIDATQGVAISSTDLLNSTWNGGDTTHFVGRIEITDGSLPEGLSISDGAITGTVTGTEGGSVTMTVYVDGWIPVTVSIDVDVTPVMASQSDISNLKTGQSVSNYITLDTDTIVADSYTLRISDGALPDGLTMAENGQITGTPTSAGTYSFTVATDVTSGRNSYTYYMDYTITVEDDGGSVAGATVESVTSDGNGNIVITYTDGTTETIAIASTETSSTGSETTESSSGGSGMAIAGLVIGIVAAVLALAVLVIVLLNGNGSKDGDKKSSDDE